MLRPDKILQYWYRLFRFDLTNDMLRDLEEFLYSTVIALIDRRIALNQQKTIKTIQICHLPVRASNQRKTSCIASEALIS